MPFHFLPSLSYLILPILIACKLERDLYIWPSSLTYKVLPRGCINSRECDLGNDPSCPGKKRCSQRYPTYNPCLTQEPKMFPP